ncbi:RsiV family protein [Bacteroides acidifaciens]|uniref:RsiV family protein n=1 Tax=Bacteroides acidifaciens TaxID=85831 RepID=UPI00258EFA31|nr:RsiV family protein [Bacteroides acidifaciens]
MRHLLTAISAAILLSVVFIMFANRDGNPIDGLSTYMSDSITEAQSRYYGDTLFQYDGKTVIADYFTEEDKEVSSLSSYLLLTYADTVAVDTCRVIGNGAYVADGAIFKYAVGIDTIRYDMRYLPDSIKPILALLPSGTVEHRYTRSFELNDSSWRCDFKFLAYLPKGHPTWLNQFIATIMRNDIQGLYLDNKGADRILKEYYSIKATPRKIGGINASSMSPEQVAVHFSKEHERLYRKDFTEEDFGPKYDYMMEVAPAWESKNGQYVTYRFYTYYYTMGAHGFMEEYYLTFDNENGRILGYNDIFGANDFKKVLDLLEQEITAQKKEFMNFDGIYPASLEKDELESNASEILKEVYDGAYYPRPALTNQGVVFSYQPYEKGSFAEGILHFVIPYSKLDIKIAL